MSSAQFPRIQIQALFLPEAHAPFSVSTEYWPNFDHFTVQFRDNRRDRLKKYGIIPPALKAMERSRSLV